MSPEVNEAPFPAGLLTGEGVGSLGGGLAKKEPLGLRPGPPVDLRSADFRSVVTPVDDGEEPYIWVELAFFRPGFTSTVVVCIDDSCGRMKSETRTVSFSSGLKWKRFMHASILFTISNLE